MPGISHRVPDTNDALVKSVALRIHRKRKLDEKARNEVEAREMEKKRKEEEKRRRLEQQTKSLAAVKDELESLHAKLDELKTEKHRLFHELKLVCQKEEKEKAEQQTNTYLAQQPNYQYQNHQHLESGKMSIMNSHKQADKMYNQYQSPSTASSAVSTAQAAAAAVAAAAAAAAVVQRGHHHHHQRHHQQQPVAQTSNPYLQQRNSTPNRYMQQRLQPSSPAPQSLNQ